MPSTFSCLSYHLVFGTKHRRRLLTADVRPRVFEYLGGIVRREGGTLTEIGGVEDHVHLLLKLKPIDTLSEFVRTLKANSSKWINDEGLLSERFAWQGGYGVFTVSESQVETVRRYLQRQESHHAAHSFEDELRTPRSRFRSTRFRVPEGRQRVAVGAVSPRRRASGGSPSPGCAGRLAGDLLE